MQWWLSLRKLSAKLLLLIFLAVVVYLGYVLFVPHKPPSIGYQLMINQSQSLNSVARQLERDGLISNARIFAITMRILGKDRIITAGLYSIKKPLSMLGLIKRITNGRPDRISITLLEGWNFKQIRAYINGVAYIRHLTESMTDEQIRDSLKITYPSMEGSLYPSTYFIAPNQSDLEVFHTAYLTMQDKLDSIWQQRNAHTNYKSPYQLLIMASLIQKETNNLQDMYHISTVFNNRLRIGMRLQTDPAVFYGLNNKVRITRDDFQINTPYNTYINKGLPPTPIASPGQNALNAAAMPNDDYKILYFVAIGSGASKFSYTFDEHAAAVNKYLRKNVKNIKAESKAESIKPAQLKGK